VTAPSDPCRFRLAREAEWQRLDEILRRAERRSVRALSDEDLLALPILYRGALSSLSVARETSLDLELVTYLEGLCARSYFFVYGARTPMWRRLAGFFVHDWPMAARALWRETVVAAALLLIGVALGWLMVLADPAWFDMLVPAELAQGRNFSASPAELRATLYDGGEGGGGLTTFAASLFTHNSGVAILCFALGFAFGAPTAMLLVYNGTSLGAMLALFAANGLGGQFAGWLMIHGTTELLAIVLAGAAGLRIGWAVVFPGSLSRLDAAAEAGRTAGAAMAGVVLMLLAAGLLEGYGRQLIVSDAARYAIGLAMAGWWIVYFYVLRPGPRAHG
jgi:uncharacterized membrane protein SpoIIM required for sporulation